MIRPLIFLGLMALASAQIEHTLPPSKVHLKARFPENFSQLRLEAFNERVNTEKTSFTRNFNWQSLGPYAMGGRITDVAIPKGEFFTMYVAAASGGIWKTTNNGTTWKALFQHEASITIGDIAVADSDPNLVWAGTGENNSLRSSYAGTGVYKSTDGGETWALKGLTDSQHIGRIIIHPTNKDIVYIAVIGHLYTKNNERGLYKTTDGGETWKRVLFFSDSVGVIDVAFAPDNPEIVYAAAWERSRKAWNFVEAGHGSGIYKSTDGGQTWAQKTAGFPNDQHVGRIGFGTSKAAPNVLYALLDNQRMKAPAQAADKQRMANTSNNVVDSVVTGIEMYRSDDYGESWKLMSKDFKNNWMYSVYGYFFGNMAVDQQNPDIVYAGGIQLAKSTDKGQTWEYISRGKNVHADHHAIWVNPLNSNHVINGNDGGLDITYDGGESWQTIANLPIAQFYAIEVDMQSPYNVYGGMQDNGTWMGSSAVPEAYGDIMGMSPEYRWKFLTGGDGFFVQVDPTDHRTFYSESQWGVLYRTKNGVQKRIRPRPKAKGERYRFNWNSPILLSQFNHLTVYFGGNKLFKSLNQGDDWLEISPDLSKQDSTRFGDVTFGTITTISESPFDPNLLYVGTDDGNVWVTQNGGVKWTLINASLPNLWVSRMVASQYQPGRVYVTHTGYREDHFDSYIHVSDDYGQTWKALSKNAPKEPVNVIREDRWNDQILYLGTDLGAYVSFNQGTDWQVLGGGLPTSAVYDLVQHPREKDIVIGTHGRGVFKLGGEYVSALTDSIRKLRNHVFDIAPVRYSFQMTFNFVYTIGQDQAVTVEILDAKRTVYKTIQERINQTAGLYQLTWNGLKPDASSRWDRAPKKSYYVRFRFGNRTVTRALKWAD